MFKSFHLKKFFCVLLCGLLLLQMSACQYAEVTGFSAGPEGSSYSTESENGTSNLPPESAQGVSGYEESQSAVQANAENFPLQTAVNSFPMIPPVTQEAATVPPPQKIEVDAPSAPQEYNQIPTQGGSGGNGYSYVAQRNGYSSLNTAVQRLAYDLLQEAVYKVAGQTNREGYYAVADVMLTGVHLDEAEIRKVVSAFKNDTPQVFWLANVFSYVYSGRNTVIKLFSVLSVQECDAAITQLQAAVQTAINNVKPGLPQFERELQIHKWLTGNCTYDTTAAIQQDEWQAFTAYGALVERSAVCEGYARAMQLLLSYMGMQCCLVSGSSQGEAHMWNLVKLESSWYHLDATWNDAEDVERYDYFNLTDRQILYDHTTDPDYADLTAAQICGENGHALSYNLALPSCNTETYNYFNQKAVKIDSLDQESDGRAMQAMCAVAQNGEKSVSFQVGSALDYDDTIGKMFSYEPYKFFYYIEETNRLLDEVCQIDWEQVTYSEIPVQRAVTVQLKGR